MPAVPSRTRKKSPGKTHFKRKHQPAKRRRLYCDCGQPAITVMTVRVGSDPQYVVHLPLCPACLALEHDYKDKG